MQRQQWTLDRTVSEELSKKMRSFKYEPIHLRPCYVKRRNEPVLIQTDSTCLNNATKDVIINNHRIMLWLVCRAFLNASLTVPAWNGWISQTTAFTDEVTPSNIGYMQPILHPITDYQTVQECIARSVEVSKKLNQKYTFITFDYAAAKIAFDIVWDKHVLEALERLLLEKFTSQYSFNIRQVDELKSLAVHPCYENCADVMENEDNISFTDQFQNFKQQVRNGQLGKTAQLWMNYCDSVWILLRFVEAIKENDLELYVNSMYAMSSLMFSSDHLNYARYLPMYYMQLKNLVEANEDAKELLGKYGISVSRSKVPACRNAIDVTIEQTINRSAKTTGGIVGFSRNVNAYYRWCLTRHKRATFMEATLECLNMSSTENDSHKTVRPSEIKRSEEDVQRLVNAFKNFMNPFDLPDFASSQLVCLSSGMPATSVVTEDMLKYISAGEAARNTFIQERILSTTVKFQETLKKQRLHTFQSMAISKIVTTAKNKAVRIKAERNFIGQLLMLVNQQGKEIDFDRLFAYPLSPVPWSLATGDGSLMKTNKAQFMHMLEEKLSQDRHEGEYEIPDDSTVIIDGNALLQSLTRLPETFGAFALTVFKCLPTTPVVHFVTDSYHASSIKQLER
jgi:hypothetical protein